MWGRINQYSLQKRIQPWMEYNELKEHYKYKLKHFNTSIKTHHLHHLTISPLIYCKSSSVQEQDLKYNCCKDWVTWFGIQRNN